MARKPKIMRLKLSSKGRKRKVSIQSYLKEKRTLVNIKPPTNSVIIRKGGAVLLNSRFLKVKNTLGDE